MVGNKLFNNQKVYVETSYDNILIIDPNKVVNSDGSVSERLVDHEELVMYADLEAKIIPRSKLVIGSNFEDTLENLRVGSLDSEKSTTINFMKPQKKGDSQEKNDESYLDSDWTDSLTLGRTKNEQVDSQLLGITNISIKVNTSYAALVTIEMEDIQGKVLFEQGENSPYSAFFQLPYPLFTLTIKGYFGKAIRYELMLKTFNARFDAATGNYKITTNFISRNYALLSDLSINNLFALPHMYHRTAEIGTTTTTTGTDTTPQDKKSIRTTKGYEMIKSVYQSYKSKGLIDENFPELTVNQMLMKLENFERYVMESYGKEDMSVLNDIEEYGNLINEFRQSLFGLIKNNFFSQYIDNKNTLIPITPLSPILYQIKKEEGGDNNIQKKEDVISDLKVIIEDYTNRLNQNATFGESGECVINGESIKDTAITANFKLNDFLKIIDSVNDSTIDMDKTYQRIVGRAPTNEEELTEFKVKLQTEYSLLSNYIVDAETFEVENSDTLKTFIIFGDILGSKELAPNSFLKKIQKLQDEFNTKKDVVEKKLAEALAEKIKSPDVGLGFNPTIKNVIAVISASADAFLRLMDDVHDNAWEKRKDPIRMAAIMSPEKDNSVDGLLNTLSSTPIDGTTENETVIYPWPQYYVTTVDEDGNEQFEDKYPGDPSEINKIQAWKYDVWPEVQFVEEYLRGSTQKDEEQNGDPYSNELTNTPYLSANAIEFPLQNRPYSNLDYVPFFYEIFERSYMNTNYTKFFRESGYINDIYSVFGDFEFENIKNAVMNSPELLKDLKSFSFNYDNLIRYMYSISNNGNGENWNLYNRGYFTKTYIKNVIEKSYGIYKLSYLDDGSVAVSTSPASIEKLKKYLKSNYSDELTFTDGYPFNDITWVQNNASKGKDIAKIQISNDSTKMYEFLPNIKTVSSFALTDGEHDRKLFTYFEWMFKNTDSPDSEVSDLESEIGGSPSTELTTNTQVINYYNNRLQNKLLLTESFVDYGTKYDTTINNLTSKQTTSLLNTPYFVNSILKGVENKKNNIQDPYVGMGYLYLNSLPLSTLREKFKSYSEGVTTDLNYVFTTLNKFSAIHKIPYFWLLKYGSIWHRYKKHIETDVDILDGIWENFGYVNAYDPLTNNTERFYTFTDYQGNSKTIKQFGETTNEVFDTILNVNVDKTFTEIQNGFYPKVMNDVYYYFTNKDLFSSGYTSSDIQSAQTNKNLKILQSDNFTNLYGNEDYTLNSWAQFIETKNNFDFEEFGENKILLIPSSGYLKFNQASFECFKPSGERTQNVSTNNNIFNGGVRGMWGVSNFGYYSNEYIDKPRPDQYLKYVDPTTNNRQAFNLGNSTTLSYSSIEDIFGVFTKEMLDEFETHFLNFCKIDSESDSDIVNRGSMTFEEFLQTTQVTDFYGGGTPPEEDLNKWRNVFENQTSTFGGITNNEYGVTLRTVMKSLLMVDKPILSGDEKSDLKTISNAQNKNFNSQHTTNFLKSEVILKIGNPGKYDRRLYESLTTNTSLQIKDKITFSNYVNGSLPTNGGTVTLGESKGQYPDAWNAMELYVGNFNDSNITYTNNGSYLTDFFLDMDIEFTEGNVKILSNLIKIYAGEKVKNPNITKTEFINKLDAFMNEQMEFNSNILNHTFINLNKSLPDVTFIEEATKTSVVDGDLIKLETWKLFQTLNDKWVSGQDFKNRTIFEDFLFMDRANRPVGDKVVINIEELRGFLTSRDPKLTVYGLLGLIYEKNNFTFIPTPAYTNFYGRNSRTRENEPLPQDVPNDLFGTFMEVDTRDSRPRMLGIYVGEPSTKLPMGENRNVRYGDDSFDITNPSTCPLRENQQNKTDYSDSNLCVGFQVDFGKRNQGIFNSISIDMDSHKNIGPTFQVLADMGQQSSGQKVAQQSQSLYNFYKSRNYKCQVTSMGNAMIQPTMYFNLTNVPLFYGPYMIMNVNHSISDRGFVTNFDGMRIPKYSLSPPDKLVASVNRKMLKSFQEGLKNKQSKPVSGSTNNNISTSNVSNIKQGTDEQGMDVTQYPDKPFVPLNKTVLNASVVNNYLSNKTVDGDVELFIKGITTMGKSRRENCFNYNVINTPTNRYITPENRSNLFENQTCIDNNNIITPIASFNSFNESLDYVYETYKNNGPTIRSLQSYISESNDVDDKASAMATLYMVSIYEDYRFTNSGSLGIVNRVTSRRTNTTYNNEYETWFNIFKKIITDS